MADIKRYEPDCSPGIRNLPEELGRMTLNLFTSEKSLIKLREALPIEKQESFVRQIQSISKKRVSFISSEASKESSKDAMLLAASIQEEYNECLQSMINEIVEESEVLDYKEHEPAMMLLRKKSLTKGMIVGNVNELLEGMERIISMCETLVIQGYQKLFIDSMTTKEKLQAVIDDRRNLPAGTRPIETLVVKQHFCERQLKCLLSLFGEANTLTDLIGKLQEFDKRQIQFQKTSQVTADAMKKLLYRQDVRKTGERRRTYLMVSYANPDTTREGLDILNDQVNNIIKNINVVCDIEDAKVRAVKKSDLGDLCEEAFDINKEMAEEELNLYQEIFESLGRNEENPEQFERCDEILEELSKYGEKSDQQLEILRLFVNKGISEPKLRLELTRFLHDLVQTREESYMASLSQSEMLQAEVSLLSRENATLRSQLTSQVIDKISEGSQSLRELFDYQEHLKKTIHASIEGGLRDQMIEVAMLGCGTSELLLGISPDEDTRLRLSEYEADYSKISSLSELLKLISRYQTWIFRLVGKLGLMADGHIHSNLNRLRQVNSLKEAREGIVGKPAEYPLTAMDRTLSEIIKSYLAGLEEKRGNIESVIKKQNVLGHLLRDFKG